MEQVIKSAKWTSLTIFIMSIGAFIILWFYARGLDQSVSYHANEPPFIYMLWSGFFMSFSLIWTMYFFNCSNIKTKFGKIVFNLFIAFSSFALILLWANAGLFGQ